MNFNTIFYDPAGISLKYLFKNKTKKLVGFGANEVKHGTLEITGGGHRVT